MLPTLRRYTAIITLLLYVLPFVAKGYHDAHHQDDFHCDSHTERHLHVQQHNCFVCDISIPVADEPTSVVASLPIVISTEINFVSPNISATTALLTCLHLRGPPAIG